MNTKWSVVCSLMAALVLAACGGKSSEGEVVLQSNEPASLGAEESAPMSGTGCYAEIQLVPGSRAEDAYSADKGAAVLDLGGKADWFPGEILVYSTSKGTDAVLEHIGGAMLKAGWQETSNIPGQNWGFRRWKKGDKEAELLTGLKDNTTIYILGCLQQEPGPTPIPVSPLGMKDAFALLGRVSGLDDLAFYGYQAFAIKEDGLAVRYTISGYSGAAQKFCYLQADEEAVELKCRDQGPPDDPLVNDLNTLKDSPELVQEAFQSYAACPDGANLDVNLTQSEAQFLCSSNNWSGSISPYK